MTDTIALAELKNKVRSDRHATSYPLVTIGAIGFHYISADYNNGPLSWIYGLPLAFIIIWALQRRTERLHGVGAGNDDTLMIAFAVFLGTSLTASATWVAILPTTSLEAATVWWVMPTVLGLAAISVRQHNQALATWAAGLATALVLGAILHESSLTWGDEAIPYQRLLPQIAFLAAAVAGLVRFRSESASMSRP